MPNLPKSTALNHLRKAQLDLLGLGPTPKRSLGFEKTLRDVRVAIREVFGEESSQMEDFHGIRFSAPPIGIRVFPESQEVKNNRERRNQEYFDRGIKKLTSLLQSMMDEIENYWTDDTELYTPQTTMKIFISHSGQDKELATLLINLLQKAFRLSSNDIRCSSVDGYRLPGGVSTDERLRIEVHDAELVVGLITPNSLKSLYVAFELGARWGVGKPMIPLLASGVLTDHLGGPLAGINALKCDNESQVNQLLEETASHLDIESERTSSYVIEIRNLVQMASVDANTIDWPSSTASKSQLSPKARELILAATEKDAGFIHHIRAMQGQMIDAGGKTMNEFGDRRSEAEWISALQQLESEELVMDPSGERKYFEVTGEGYSIADELRTDGNQNREEEQRN